MEAWIYGFLLALPIFGTVMFMLYLSAPAKLSKYKQISRREKIIYYSFIIVPFLLSGLIFSSVFDGYKFWVPLVYCGVEALMLMLGAACSIVLARKSKLHYLFTALASVLSLLFIATIIIAVFMV